MAEYIKKDELLKFKADVYDEDGHLLYAVPTGCIVAMPLADVAPVRHGRWNCVGHVCIDGEYEDVLRCSNCSIPHDSKSRYCPNCGSKMDEEINKESYDNG